MQTMNKGISELLLEKLREQVERTDHLISLIPSGSADWHPNQSAIDDSSFFPLRKLLFHLTECLAGFCAALSAAYKDQLAHFARLRNVSLSHSCEVEEARALLGLYMSHVEEGFALLTDDDLIRQIPTIFVPEGEALFTILIGNLEHYINHKYQLFFYLKMLGVPVTTRDLYHLRPDALINQTELLLSRTNQR
jgi:hypothetical protein